MKKKIIFLVSIVLLAMLIGISVKINNKKQISTDDNVGFEPAIEVSGYKIKSHQRDNVYYIFVPKNVDISDLKIYFNIDINSTTSGKLDQINDTLKNNFNKNDEVIVKGKNDKQYTIKVMQSDIPSICINLDNVSLETVTKGSKEDKYSGFLQVIGANEDKYNITDKIIELKGRGNSTWEFEKKPFQIKFKESENLLGLNGSAQKWILLANHADKTLMKNQLSFDIQQQIGLSNSVQGTFIDLYINGEFLGNYTLCDKIEIGESRIDLKNPEGFISEIDVRYGNEEEYNFTSEITQTLFVIKDVVNKNEYENTCIEFEKIINKFEKLLYVENPNWTEITDIIDVESFAKYYFLTELEHDTDRFLSSTFLYKDGENDKLHIGPIWDSDLAYKAKDTNDDYNLNFIENHKDYARRENTQIKHDWYNQLYKHKEFVDLLYKTYEESIKPVYIQLIANIDKHVQSMPKSINMNTIRWEEKHGGIDTYKRELKILKDWLQDRIDYLNRRYSK